MSSFTSPPGVDPSMSDAFGTSAPIAVSSESTSMTSESAISPFAYYFAVITIWVLLFLIWVPVLLIHNRRVQQWMNRPKTSQTEDTSFSDGDAEHQPQTVSMDRNKFQRQQSNVQVTILVLMIVASLVAFSLAIVTHLSCDFISLEDPPISLDWIPAGRREDGSFVQVELTSLGLWAFGSTNTQNLEHNIFLGSGNRQETCFSAEWLLGQLGSLEIQTARTSAVFASILGGASLLFLLWSACHTANRTRVRYLAIPLLLTTFVQLLPMVLFGTELCSSMSNDCSLSSGGTASLSAAMFWFFATLAASAFPPIVAQSAEMDQPNTSSEP